MTYPRDDPRFAVGPSDYPGGEDAYWRDYDEAQARASREVHRRALGLTEVQMADREAYFALKKHVHQVALRVAEQAGIDHRTLARWLVLEKGFPWRQNCSYFDLRRLLRFLEAPDTVAEVSRVPPAPPPRA